MRFIKNSLSSWKTTVSIFLVSMMSCAPLPKEGQEHVHVSMNLEYPAQTRSSTRGQVGCAPASDWWAGIGSHLAVLVESSQSMPTDPSGQTYKALADLTTHQVDFGSVPLDTSFHLHVYRYPQIFSDVQSLLDNTSKWLDSTASTSSPFKLRESADAQGTATINVKVQPDNGTPGLVFNIDNSSTITPVDNQTLLLDNLSEASGSLTFKVSLGKRPKENVTLNLKKGPEEDLLALDEVSISQSSLTFTPGNWNVEQSVQVQSVNDTVGDGDRVAWVVPDNLTTNDPDYAECYLPLLQTTVQDDENNSGSIAIVTEWKNELTSLGVFQTAEIDNLSAAAQQGIFDQEVGHLSTIDNLSGGMVGGAFAELAQQRPEASSLLTGQSYLLQGIIPVLKNHTSTSQETAASVGVLGERLILHVPSFSSASTLDWALLSNEWTQGIIRGFPGTISSSEATSVSAEWVAGLARGTLLLDPASFTARQSPAETARLADTDLLPALNGALAGVFDGFDNVSASLPLSPNQWQDLSEATGNALSQAVSADSALGGILDNISVGIADQLQELVTAGKLTTGQKNTALLRYVGGIQNGLNAVGTTDPNSYLSSIQTKLQAATGVSFSDLTISSSSGVTFAPVRESMNGRRDDNATHTGVLWTLEITDDGTSPTAVELTFVYDNDSIASKTYQTISTTDITSSGASASTFKYMIRMTPYSPSIDVGDMVVTMSDNTGSDNFTYPVSANMFVTSDNYTALGRKR